MYIVNKVPHSNAYGIWNKKTGELFVCVTPSSWEAEKANRHKKEAERLLKEFEETNVDEVFWRTHRLNTIFVP